MIPTLKKGLADFASKVTTFRGSGDWYSLLTSIMTTCGD